MTFDILNVLNKKFENKTSSYCVENSTLNLYHYLDLLLIHL